MQISEEIFVIFVDITQYIVLNTLKRTALTTPEGTMFGKRYTQRL